MRKTIPPDFTHEEWDALTPQQQAAAWSAALAGMYQELGRVVFDTPWAHQRVDALHRHMIAAGRARDECLERANKPATGRRRRN
jgi:hypothetical protein